MFKQIGLPVIQSFHTFARPTHHLEYFPCNSNHTHFSKIHPHITYFLTAYDSFNHIEALFWILWLFFKNLLWLLGFSAFPNHMLHSSKTSLEIGLVFLPPRLLAQYLLYQRLSINKTELSVGLFQIPKKQQEYLVSTVKLSCLKVVYIVYIVSCKASLQCVCIWVLWPLLPTQALI